ncbi:MAG: MFS transporter [Myxococcales bacterium]|nr:MFS transporter [Myxococcales bacterium]
MLQLTPMRGRQVFALGLSQLVGWGALFYALVPLQHAHAFGVPASTSSLLITLALVVSGVVAYPVGVLLDRVGGRAVLLAGSISGVLVLLGLAISPPGWLWPLFVALGVVHALMLYEPAFAVVTAHIPTIPARMTALRNVTLLGGLASLVFAPLTALALDAAGSRMTLLLLALALAAVTLPSHIRMPAGPGATRVHPRGEEPGPAPRGGRAGSTRAVFTLALAFGVASFVATAMLFLLLDHLAQDGVSPTQGALVLGLTGACQLLGRILHPALARVRSPVVIVAIGLASQGIGAIGLLLGILGLPLFMLAFGGGSGLLTVARPAVVEHLFGLSGFGRTSAVVVTVAVFARAAAPAAVAVTAPFIASTSALSALALVSLLAVPGLLLGLGHQAGPPGDGHSVTVGNGRM